MSYLRIFWEHFYRGACETLGFFVMLLMILGFISWLDLEFTVTKRKPEIKSWGVEGEA